MSRKFIHSFVHYFVEFLPAEWKWILWWVVLFIYNHSSPSYICCAPWYHCLWVLPCGTLLPIWYKHLWLFTYLNMGLTAIEWLNWAPLVPPWTLFFQIEVSSPAPVLVKKTLEAKTRSSKAEPSRIQLSCLPRVMYMRNE